MVQVVGYGMAVAKAQYPIAEICANLRARGVNVRVSKVTAVDPHSTNSRSSSPFTLWLDVCLVNATSYLPKHLYHTTVRPLP